MFCLCDNEMKSLFWVNDMLPRELLEFITRHTAHKSAKYISGVAGTDAGNLHSCLSGKRALPFPMAQRVAAAVGLTASMLSNQLAITMAPGTVINLEVGGDELPVLGKAVQALAGNRSCSWRLVMPVESVSDGGVFAIAIVGVGDGYVVVNLSWMSGEDAYQVLGGQIRDFLPGVWLPQEPEQFCFSLASAEWIRLRAGVESIRTLDKMFLRETEVGVEEWAQLLMDLHQMGAKPRVVSRFMQSIIQSARCSEGESPA